MTTHDLITALQETLAKYQQNGVKEEGSVQRLEAQLAALKADVTQLQDALQTTQDEKRLLLETLREQSQQLLTLTQHVATAPTVSPPEGAEVMMASPAVPSEPSSVTVAEKAESAETTAPKKAKTAAKTKTPPAKTAAKTKPTATQKEAKPAKSGTTAKQKAPTEPEKSTEPDTETPPKASSLLDRLWDMVREFNAGKPFSQRIRFDENLAINYFGFKPSEWKAWFKGTNSAKVKRQPSQVRTNQRKAAKEGIDVLKQKWNTEFPSANLEIGVEPKPETASLETPTAPAEEATSTVEAATPALAESAEAVAVPTSEDPKTEKKKMEKTTAKKSKKAPSKESAKAPASKKPGKETTVQAAEKAKPMVEASEQKAMQELFEFFQSWNQKQENASVRFTPHTAAAFDNIELDQAREWIDQNDAEVKQFNEGVPPNNRREARQALEQLKETWSVL